MAAIGNWERSLKNILTETEANISSFKRNMNPIFESTPFTQRNSGIGSGDGLSPYFSPKPSSYSPRLNQFPESFKTRAQSFDKGSSLAASVSNRVEQLEEVTNSLSSTVRSLQYENKMQGEEIKRLKDELKHVTKRRHEKGVDMATEQKLKMWQREVRSELETIRSLHKTKSKNEEYSSLNDITLVSLSKDISDSKRLLQEETDLLRRELDNLRNRLLKLENEVAVSIGESKDLGMRQLRLEKDVSSVNDRYRSQSRTFTKIEKDNTIVQDEIDGLRHDIKGIQYELDKLSSIKNESRKSERNGTFDKTKMRRQKETSNYEIREKGFIKQSPKDKIYSDETFANSLDDLSILSTELDDLSLNTSLQFSDEIDQLDHDFF